MAEDKRVVNGEGEGFVMMRFPGTSYVDHMGPLHLSIVTLLDGLKQDCSPCNWQDSIQQIRCPLLDCLLLVAVAPAWLPFEGRMAIPDRSKLGRWGVMLHIFSQMEAEPGVLSFAKHNITTFVLRIESHGTTLKAAVCNSHSQASAWTWINTSMCG